MAIAANRMRRGSYLIKGGAVITVDPALGTLPKADVLVRDGVIVSVGRRSRPMMPRSSMRRG